MALDVWSSLGDSASVADGTPVARLTLVDTTGASHSLMLLAGEHTAEWLYDTPGVAGTVRHRLAPVAHAEPRASGGHAYVYRASFPLSGPSAAPVAQIGVQVLHPTVRLNVDRLLLDVPFDARFRLAFEAPPVRVWENPRALPRAWWVGSYVVEPDPAAHLELLKQPAFDPHNQVALYAKPNLPPGGSPAVPSVAARVESETDNTVALSVDAPAAGLLVVSQTAAPGWRAWVDGQAAPALPADGILTAIPVPEGSHRVALRYLPNSFRIGATISLLTLTLLTSAFAAIRLRRHHRVPSVSDHQAGGSGTP
jgi:hypothetical protein